MTDKPDTKFDVGGVWDESEWRIVYDYEKTSVSPTYDPKPCPHASDIHGDLDLGVKPEYNYPVTRWTVPRVVVAMNEYPGIVEGQLMAIGASARSGKPEQLGWLLCALVAKVVDLEERLAAVEASDHG